MNINKDYNPPYLNSFLNYLSSVLNKSSNTIKEYNYDLVTFLKYLKTPSPTDANQEEVTINDIPLTALENLTLNDLYDYTSYLKDVKINDVSARARKVASLKTFFKYLNVKANLIKTNPAQYLDTPKIGKRLPKYLTLEDSKKLLNTVNEFNSENKQRDYAIITLFLNCGMRLSELVSIDINHIDFENDKLNVIGKGNKERTIYLNKACIKSINDYILTSSRKPVKNDSQASKMNPLFLSERKKRISKRTVQYIVKNYLTMMGLSQYSTHKLRHTAATLMYQYGDVDIRALQELLGHESISTTQIYTHVDNSQVRAAVESNPLSDFK
ncbi:MAG: tyrosine recombinase XerC [Oscillospiraceae bacterium]|nr:tyrosine recombinase XerC [Oscillospiraceae bacterium]